LAELENNSVSQNSLDAEIQQNEIRQAISQVKNNKASGNDLILNEMIKCAAHILTRPLTKLFNLFLSSGHFPKQWGESHIVPIHKSGPKDDPNNYRGISVISCLAKLFTTVKRLTNYLDENYLISANQAGFRNNFGTNDNLFVIDTLISKYNNTNKRLYACFVDFKKAFDSVWREGLRYKLLNSGIGGKLYSVIKSMYSNPQTCVKTPAGLTPLFTTDRGVRQGCNLSPTLFNLFINDLVKDLDSPDCAPPSLHNLLVSSLLYADDVVLFSESETGLQCALDKLHAFCEKWKLPVNLKKTKVMIFNKLGRIFKNMNFTFGTDTIDIATSYSYLGLTLSPSGTYSLAKKQLSLKARKAIFSLKSLMHSSLSPKALLKLFSTCIKPIILYGCEIWGKAYSDDSCPAEITQNRFCKNVLGVHRNSSNIASRAELGMYPIDIDISIRTVKYWLRLKQLDFSTHPLQVDALLCQQSIPNNSRKKYWLQHVKEILDNTGYSYLWNSMNSQLDNKHICTSLRKRLEDIYIQTFSHRLSTDNGKLRFFKKLKKGYSMETYLTLLDKFEVRSAMCKLRISAHPLEIERGRYKKLPVGERTCNHCMAKPVEDEIHFISNCLSNDQERKELFEEACKFHKNFQTLTDENKTITLLTSHNPRIIEKVGHFVFHCFQKRSQTLNT